MFCSVLYYVKQLLRLSVILRFRHAVSCKVRHITCLLCSVTENKLLYRTDRGVCGGSVSCGGMSGEYRFCLLAKNWLNFVYFLIGESFE